MGNHYQSLNAKQRQYIKLYTGHSQLGGNATRCYMAAYDQKNEFCAQRSASFLMNHNPHIAAILAQAEERAINQITINAKYVLDQSVRLHRLAMGDDSFDHVVVETDPDTGEERTTVTEQRSYDPATAKAALQLIGQHKDIQAFSVTVEHTHTHLLERRLAARSKLIEGRATAVDPAQVAHQPGVEAAQVVGMASADDDDGLHGGHTSEVGHEAHTAAHVGEVGPAAGGQEERAHEAELSSPVAGRAPAN